MTKIMDPTARSVKIKASSSIISLHNISVQDKLSNRSFLILAWKPVFLFSFFLGMSFKNET